MAIRTGKQSFEVATQTRARIIKAAIDRFAEKGFAATSLREIAVAAGTSHGLIRHHFGSKEALWRAMIDDFVARFASTFEPLLAQRGERASELLKQIAGGYIRLSAASPPMTKIIFSECHEPGEHLDYLLAHIMPIHASIESVFRAAQAEGKLGRFDPDSFFLFLVLLGAAPLAMQGLTHQFYHKDLTRPEDLDQHVELVLETLFAGGE